MAGWKRGPTARVKAVKPTNLATVTKTGKVKLPKIPPK